MTKKDNAPSWATADRVIQDRVKRQSNGGKSARLREAITAGIVSGDLEPGTQLPPEPRIAEATGISLGTVRHALSQLRAQGYISREHGRGTFVQTDAAYFTERWHFRFRHKTTGEPVSPRIALLERRPAEPRAQWSRALGPHERYISIKRLGTFENGQRFLSELVLPYDPFSRLIEVPASDIERKGIRFLLADSFQVPVVQSRITAKLSQLSDSEAIILDIPASEPAIELTFLAETFDSTPVFLLTVWLPGVDYELDLTSRTLMG